MGQIPRSIERISSYCYCCVVVPSASPGGVHGTLIDNTTLYLTWEGPPSHLCNGPLRGYKVCHHHLNLFLTYFIINQSQ